MDERKDEWMYGWMDDGWMDGWMDGRADERTGKQTSRQTYKLIATVKSSFCLETFLCYSFSLSHVLLASNAMDVYVYPVHTRHSLAKRLQSEFLFKLPIRIQMESTMKMQMFVSFHKVTYRLLFAC